MSRVTTKVTDLESLQRAKKELGSHLEAKKINIQLEINEFKSNFLPKNSGDHISDNQLESSKFSSKFLSKIIVKNFIKPKSKIVAKASIFITSFILDKYGGNVQTSIAKWLTRKDQALIDE